MKLSLNDITYFLAGLTTTNRNCGFKYKHAVDADNFGDYTEVVTDTHDLNVGDKIYFYWYGSRWNNYGYFCIVSDTNSKLKISIRKNFSEPLQIQNPNLPINSGYKKTSELTFDAEGSVYQDRKSVV